MKYDSHLLEKGYEFSGHYSFFKTEMLEQAKKLREKGHKATVVYVPGSKYSRSGPGGGYSIYWKESLAVKKQEKIEQLKRELEYFEKKKENLLKEIASLEENN